MKHASILFCLLLTLGASATKVKKNFNLIVEDFRGFNNSTLKLGTTNDRYFTFSGPGIYGLGNNDNGKPIFTLYKNSRITINHDQLRFFYPEYFEFNWMVVFKIPKEAKFTISDFALQIDSHNVNFWQHRYDSLASNGYIYTMRLAEIMRNLNGNYYIERTVFADYPWLDPLNIDTIYLRGHKMVETEPVGLEVINNEIKIHSSNYQLKVEVRNFRGDIILSETRTEFPINVEPGLYIIAVYSENRMILSKKIYIN